MQHNDLVLHISMVHYCQSVLPKAVNKQEERTTDFEVVPVPTLFVVASQHHEADGTENFLGVAKVDVALEDAQVHGCDLFACLHCIYIIGGEG